MQSETADLTPFAKAMARNTAGDSDIDASWALPTGSSAFVCDYPGKDITDDGFGEPLSVDGDDLWSHHSFPRLSSVSTEYREKR